MCGIAGSAGGPDEGRHQRVSSMLAALRHRGPDDEGTASAPGWCVGARRLAVLDLEHGGQPVASEDGGVTAVLNGEIYNFEALRRRLLDHGHVLRSTGDTEVLAHLWEEEGAGLVERLRGMFALAVVDRAAGVVVLARDRVGKKPLYWTVRDGGLAFASELKALRAGVGGLGGLDRHALHAYLRFGFVPEGECILPGVHKLPPGSLLSYGIADGRVTQRRWASWSWEVDEALDGDGALDILDEELAEAVRLRLRADVPVAVFLSGGLDSGMVAALAARTGTPVRALTVSMDGAPDELPLARATAARTGCRLEEVRVEAATGLRLLPVLAEIFDEPLADASAIPTLLVARAARERATVVLNGDGGDEVLGGYRRLLAARAAGWPLARRWLPLAARAAGRAGFRSGWSRRLADGLGGGEHPYLSWGPAKLSAEQAGAALGEDPAPPRSFTALADRLGGLPLAQAVRALDFELFLPGDLLVKMDRATMATSLEARSPFLDQELVRRLSRVDPRVLLARGRSKAVLRRAASGLLPAEVVRAPKRGFEAPLADWLQGPWAEEVRTVTEDSAAAVRTVLEPVGLSPWRDWSSHTDRERSARAVFTLVTLEHWLRRWR